MKKVFIIACMLTMLIPFVGMIGFATNETAEKTELASWPEFFEEGKFNTEYLAEAGDYFEDHFAFRSWLVSAYANLEKYLLHTSANDQVILGKDNWLFYTETLPDFQGEELLSQRELNNIVHNLSLIKQDANNNGAQFLFVIAPNKNSIYPEYMPYYYTQGEKSNASRLLVMLNEAGIENVDLFSLLKSEKQNQQLYYISDSHWNNTGAYLAYTNMMEALGLTAKSYDWQQAQTILHTGDLEEMLSPETLHLEEDVSIENQSQYTLVDLQEEFDTMNNILQTQNDNGNSHSLLMYRDSFGNALFEYMADTFDRVFYTRLVPYNLYQVQATQSDVVILERVERRIGSLQEQAALISPVQANAPESERLDDSIVLEMQETGDFMKIYGEIDAGNLEDDSTIYVSLTNAENQTYTYETFYTQGEEGCGNGFEVYLPLSWFDENTAVSIHYSVKDEWYASEYSFMQ
jgi:hypothetical protein